MDSTDEDTPYTPITVGSMIVSTWMNSVRYKARVTRFIDKSTVEVMWAYRDGRIWPHRQSERIICMSSIVSVLTLDQFFDSTLDLESMHNQNVKQEDDLDNLDDLPHFKVDEDGERRELYTIPPPTPSPMPETPSIVNRLQLVEALSTWANRSEKVLTDYQKELKAWTDQQIEECEKEVAPFELKMAETEQTMRRKIEQIEIALAEATRTYTRLIRNRRQQTRKGTQRVHKDAVEWISEQETVIADARKTIDAFTKATSPPEELSCPITLELMNDPVLAMDGYTYEREAIQKHFDSFQPSIQPSSPCTNVPLQSRDLMPNIAIRSLCRQWHDDQKQQEKDVEIA